MDMLMQNITTQQAAMNQILQHIANQGNTARAPNVRDDKLGRDPDPFTGKDPTKLIGFIVACQAVFLARTSTYTGPGADRRKVSFALTFLRDDARAWFDKYILEGDVPNPPLFMVDWRAFLAELLQHFGPANAIRDSEHAIEELSMSDNHHIERFDIEFMRHAAIIGWNDAALRHRYRAALPNRIKDVLQLYAGYNDLDTLREYASSIDHRHWERVAEKRRDTRGSSSTTNTSQSNSNKSGQSSGKSKDNASSSDNRNNSGNSGRNNNNSNNNNRNNSGNSGRNNNNNGGNNNSNNRSSQGSSNSDKPYAKHLTKDGKLKPEVRQYRLDNGLCSFCGGKGHFSDKCPKKSAPSSARAAKVTPPAAAPPLTATITEVPSTPSAPPAQAKN